MPQNKPQSVDSVDDIRTESGWSMNQEIADELQSHPQHPLIFGVDGRFLGGLRRFQGFRRLDYDIRYPHSNGGYATIPLVGDGIAGLGPTGNLGGGMVAFKDYAGHTWDCGKAFGTLNPTYIDTAASRIYQFIGGTLDRSRRVEGVSDRRPLSVFIIHGDDSQHYPYVKMLGRSIGDASLSAFFQVALLGDWSIRDSFTPPAMLDMRAKHIAVGKDQDWIGIGLLGRFVLLSHKLDDSNTLSKGGDSWLYYSPYKAYRGKVAGLIGSPDYHALPNPESAFPAVDNGSMQKGDKYLRCKLMGTRGWAWLHTPAAGTSSDGAVKYEGLADSAQPANITAHAPSEKFKLRIRFINYTTGFVSPMSQPLTAAIGPVGEGIKISWAPGVQSTGSGTTAGAVEWTPTAAARKMMASLFGVEQDGYNVTLTGALTPPTVELQGVCDVRLQIWVTMSTPADNPSNGGGYYFLDQEVPVVYRRPESTDPLFGTINVIHLWPGWLGDASLGTTLIGGCIPSMSNDELMSQDLYLPDSDDVGELEPSLAFGNASGCLLSLSDGGALSTAPENASSGDLKCSPPWKFYPGGWIESCSPRFRHVVYPKGLMPPKFVSTGDITFLIDQNRFVRIVRDGTSILVDDVEVYGGVNRDGVCVAGNSVLIVTSSGMDELNPTSLSIETIQAVQRIITERWQQYALEGRIMSGYDPQLRAVFVAPRRALTSSSWFRTEAMIIWTTTGRITMLSDVYWCGMTRGVHPVTGKEHLFFIDPAHNITYADASIDSSRPATMTGICAASDPGYTGNWSRQQAVWTIKVVAVAYAADAAIVVDGVPLQVDYASSWTDGAGTVNGIAVSIRDAILALRTLWTATGYKLNVSAVTAVGDTVTITSLATGIVNEDFNFVSLLGISATDMVVTRVTAGETTAAGAALAAGGGYQGKVTNIAGAATKTITDSVMNATNGGTNFDLYAWYNPHNRGALGVQPTLSALVGSQVYFFRLVADDKGMMRPALVADVRIKSNTQQTFLYNESEVTYHNGATSVLADDHYCISPVVFQVVGAPIEAGEFPGSGIDLSASIESLGVYLRNRRALSASSGVRLPSTNPLQGSLFFGIASVSDLESRVHGSVAKPTLNSGVNTRLASSSGAAGSLIWSESKMGIVTAHMGKTGNTLFPVVTCFGTNYMFDLIRTQARVARHSRVAGGTPEGF